MEVLQQIARRRDLSLLDLELPVAGTLSEVELSWTSHHLAARRLRCCIQAWQRWAMLWVSEALALRQQQAVCHLIYAQLEKLTELVLEVGRNLLGGASVLWWAAAPPPSADLVLT